MIARVLVAAALLAGCYSPPAGTCARCEVPCGPDDAADGRIEGSEWPVQVGSAAGWKQADAGTFHVCAIDAADALWCWGDGSQRQLGSGVGLSAAPRPVTAVPAR